VRPIAAALILTSLCATTGCAYLRGVGGPREFEPIADEPLPAQPGARYDGALRLPMVEEWTWTLPDPGIWDLSRFERGQPAVAADRVFVGNSRMAGLTVLDRNTGAELFHVDTINPVQSPAQILGDRVLVADTGGYVYLLDWDGNTLWRYHAGGPIYREPVIHGEQILVGTSTDLLISLSLETGQWRWSFRPEETLVRNELSVLGSSRPVIHEGKVYLGLSDGRVVCLDAHNGVLQWELQIGEGRFLDVDSPPVVTEEELLVVGGYSGPIVALDIETRAIAWRIDQGIVGDLLYQYGRVYYADTEGALHCLVAADGTEEWMFKPKATKELMNSPVGSGRTLLVTLNSGQLFAVDAFAGDVLWRHEPKKSLLGAGMSPTIAGRQVLVLTGDGVLRSLRAPPGFYDTLDGEPAHRESRELTW
jgi:outer membrane protein assembly factor BamB